MRINPEPIFDRITDADVAVVYDDVENSRWWLLRCLPALAYRGFEHFTYPTSWRQIGRGEYYDELEYDYHWLDDLQEAATTPDLGVVTNEYYERRTAHSINYLVNHYTTTDATLVVVTDQPRFTPEGGQRPLYQEQFATRVGPYDRIFDAYEAHYDRAGVDLPLADTRNLYMQDNANVYELVTDDRIKTTAELFEVLPDAPYLPLYRAFSRMFSREKEPGTELLDSDDQIQALARWLRRRIEWDRTTAKDVAQSLNRAVATDGHTFDTATMRSKSARKAARDAANAIASDASPIHRRYYDWLNGGLL